MQRDSLVIDIHSPLYFLFNVNLHLSEAPSSPQASFNSYFRDFIFYVGFSNTHYSTVTTLPNFPFPQCEQRRYEFEIVQCLIEKRIEGIETREGRFLDFRKVTETDNRGILFLENTDLSEITRSAVITCARALAKVGENYGTPFARPWLSRGRCITNWLVWLARARSRIGTNEIRSTAA